jgi:hypothetical protein
MGGLAPAVGRLSLQATTKGGQNEPREVVTVNNWSNFGHIVCSWVRWCPCRYTRSRGSGSNIYTRTTDSDPYTRTADSDTSSSNSNAYVRTTYSHAGATHIHSHRGPDTHSVVNAYPHPHEHADSDAESDSNAHPYTCPASYEYAGSS